MLEHGIRLLDLDPLRSMFYEALLLQYQRRSLGGPTWTYYEFGVGTGTSMEAYARAARSMHRLGLVDPARFRMVGFDTFHGLPPPVDPRDHHPEWRAGRFAESEEAVRRRVSAALPRSLRSGLELVPGAFLDSLTAKLRERLADRPPAIVTVDCDYYSSSRQALDWLVPLLRTGCLLYFDDVWEFWGQPDVGELAAIREFEGEGRGRLIPFTGVRVPPWGQMFVYLEPGKG